jgi:hypothetical protein
MFTLADVLVRGNHMKTLQYLSMFIPRRCNGTRESHENLTIFKVCLPSPTGTRESHENLTIFTPKQL